MWSTAKEKKKKKLFFFLTSRKIFFPVSSSLGLHAPQTSILLIGQHIRGRAMTIPQCLRPIPQMCHEPGLRSSSDGLIISASVVKILCYFWTVLGSLQTDTEFPTTIIGSGLKICKCFVHWIFLLYPGHSWGRIVAGWKASSPLVAQG